MKLRIIFTLVMSICLYMYAPFQTITTPGHYLFGEDVVYLPSSANDSIIKISASNVIVDLGQRILTQGNAVGGLSGIVVDPNLSGVIIKNGFILNLTGTGIGIGQGCSQLLIDNMVTVSCSDRGINLAGTEDAPIISGGILNCVLTNCCTGARGDNVLTLSHCRGITIRDSSFTNNEIVQDTLDVAKLVTCTQCELINLGMSDNVASSTVHAINLIDSYENDIRDCNIKTTRSIQANAYGLEVGGFLNLIENNLIKATFSNAITSSNTIACISLQITASGNQIVDNVMSNSTHLAPTSSQVFAYGIEMQQALPPLSTVGLPNFATGATQNICAWSPSGRYLATAGTDGLLRILERDRGRYALVASFDHGAAIHGISWSPDGHFIAIGGTRSGVNVRAFLFSGSGLTAAGTFDTGGGSSVFDVDWSPDGKYLAFGTSVSPQLRVIEHNNTTFNADIASFAHGANVNSVSWSSDNRYLAMGGVTSGGSTTHIFDFSFSSTASAVLTPLASHDHGATVNDVSFSPDIRFLAQGGASSGGITLRALSFNGSTLTASPSTNIATGATVNTVDWASDGRHLASGQATGGGAEIRTFSFEGTTLVPAQTFTHGATVNSVDWAPNGRSIALVGAVSTTELKEVSALQFAERCTIRGNKIATILGGPLNFGLGRGRGISASSSENLIIQNSVFDTDINYHFVNNTFSLYLTNVEHRQPSTIANLSFPPV